MDLNLLLVLHMVLSERSATAAARRLAVSQSAVSNSLARLRELLRDPLVVRHGRGLTPTPYAQRLAPALSAAVEHLENVVNGQHDFDPAQTTRRFTLACSDANQIYEVPLLFAAFARRMPRAVLRVVSLDYLITSDGLATGEVDASLGPRIAARGMHFAPLYTETAAVLVRKDHPTVGETLTREQFNQLSHVDTHVALGKPGVVHKAAGDLFARHGLSRRIVLSVPHFSSAAMTAARTDCVATLPLRIARLFCSLLPMRVLPVPAPATFKLEMGIIWHERSAADEGSRCFREVITEALKDPKPGTVRRPRRRRRRAA